MSVYTHSFIACRQTGQSTSDEIKSRDLRRELEDKEDISRHKRQREKPRSFTGNNYVTHLVDIYTIIYLYSVEERRGGGKHHLFSWNLYGRMSCLFQQDLLLGTQ